MKLRRFASWSLALVMGIALASCYSDPGSTDPGGSRGTIRVLFIGNSLTYTNDLPGLVESIASASGKTIKTESLTYPDFALIDHWTTAERRVLHEGNFDFVVLQQGPSSLDINRDSLRLWTAMWAPEIRAAGAKPVLFAVWPESARLFAFPAVAESYRLAADDVGGLLVPVGDIWLEIWNATPSAPLYGPDGFHPGLEGTYAAAVAMVSVLTRTEPTSLATDFPVGSPLAGIENGLAATIRTSARTILDRNGMLDRP